MGVGQLRKIWGVACVLVASALMKYSTHSYLRFFWIVDKISFYLLSSSILFRLGVRFSLPNFSSSIRIDDAKECLFAASKFVTSKNTSRRIVLLLYLYMEIELNSLYCYKD